MNKCKLGDVASVIISNVDKKSNENEIKVKLCNFTDVYYNWAITLRDEPKLMIATATNNEICKYKLHKGDVAITKDSETKEDIGQSTLIADEIPDMLLGYHCALIRPNTDKLLGAYLNAVLHTKLATRYFELNASGSGQRYTLSVDAINDFQLYLPSINEQERISKILTDIDRKIENNTCINDNLAQQAKLLYDYWFTQFDFPDENDKPYRSSGGQMVWNNLLKKKIPLGWEVKTLSELLKKNTQSFPDEALELMRDNCDNLRDLALIDILSSTGMRVGELVRLNRDDINFEERECVVFGKGSKERMVYFDARTKIHLQNYLSSRKDSEKALFVGLKAPYKRLSIAAIEVRLRELGKRLNIAKVHPHKFRRTLATRAIDKGMPIEQLQHLLGHERIDTTLQYAMVKQSNVKIAHRKYIG